VIVVKGVGELTVAVGVVFVVVVVVVVVVLVQALRIMGRINAKDTINKSHFLLSLLNNVISFLFLFIRELPLLIPDNLRLDVRPEALPGYLRNNAGLLLRWPY
jgi:hypothetical protein